MNRVKKKKQVPLLSKSHMDAVEDQWKWLLENMGAELI